ncbi:DNA-directed RNA polymerase subunit delta [Marininema mesophilum]|uniref:Probable DNA-directed RNA polymerase subunit delta n=1 Tax=Marininema mesophilum TaxID=1048340 RepID=A0A1H2T7P9_9BACL|nr:DNA-directed RNA polymerase subunit delta [Marininema mesophilum]SDW39912.1 DNA-directed RNA polymerase subunit delta [Marininema mesophilum]
MSDNLAKDLSTEEIRETAMVDLAYDIFSEKGEPIVFRTLMDQISEMKGFSKGQSNHYMAQLYTEINIDGRFICVGKSLWGIRAWYPTDQATDSAVAQNVKDDYTDEDEDELYDEDAPFNVDNEETEEDDFDDDAADFDEEEDEEGFDDDDEEELDEDED